MRPERATSPGALFFVLPGPITAPHLRTMPAILTTPPPARCFSDSPVWVTLSTDETISAPASIVLTVTGSGPSAAETLRLEFAGNDLTFTVADPLTADALELPVKGAETLAEYADIVAERLRAHEVLHDYFAISRDSSGAETITLTQRLLAVVDIVATDALNNVTTVATSVTEVTVADSLRALVEVYQDTGDTATDVRLLSLHSPYALPAGTTSIDIQAAFATLQPHLPAESGIYPGLLTSLIRGQTPDCWMDYYLRYADKSGLPAVAQSLQRSDTYKAILGAAAVNTLAVPTTPLRHNYVRANGSTILPKPILDVQPDWLYWICPDGITGVYMNVTLYWSDGTESNYLPFSTTSVAVVAGKMYYFGTGPRQLKIGSAPLPGGADPAAYVVGYLAAINNATGDPLIGVHSVTYDLFYSGDWMQPILLFSNGVGGCETVCFRGKTVATFKPTSEEYRKSRQQKWTPKDGDFETFSNEGRGAWDVNTGWCDIDYIRHLQQLPLAQAWLVDLVKKKFLKVVVEPDEIETNKDDETIFALPLTIRAGWVNLSANF